MTTQWGTPLTGAQMKALRAAGLPDDEMVKASYGVVKESSKFRYIMNDYHLPANHIAYTLLNAGWLDGRNVRLWFGGDKAPDDWLERSRVLLGDGSESTNYSNNSIGWKPDRGTGIPFAIAYIAKDEASYPADGGLKDQVRDPSECQSAFQTIADAVTLNKMTEAEWSQRFGLGDSDVAAKLVLDQLGLIKPEPTREERFWAKFQMPFTSREHSNSLKGWVKLALEFER